jgi:hypothetical protein
MLAACCGFATHSQCLPENTSPQTPTSASPGLPDVRRLCSPFDTRHAGAGLALMPADTTRQMAEWFAQKTVDTDTDRYAF